MLENYKYVSKNKCLYFNNKSTQIPKLLFLYILFMSY